MKRLLFVLFLVVLFPLPHLALGQTLADSTVVKATTDTGPTLLDQIAAMLASIAPILSFLVGTGLVYKYVPFLSKLPNVLIPFLNALIAFLGVFAGPAPAHAGVFGDFVHALSFPAKMAGSMFLSVVASSLYETFLRGPLEKFGVYRAGATRSEVAAKEKVSGT